MRLLQNPTLRQPGLPLSSSIPAGIEAQQPDCPEERYRGSLFHEYLDASLAIQQTP